MNKDRKEKLHHAQDHLESASDLISSAMIDEQMAFAALPPGFQSGPNGEKMEDAISNMSDAMAYILTATVHIEEILKS